MIEEAYCSYELAKLLNEKGFVQETLMVYNQNGNFMPNGAIRDTYQNFYSAPTHQMAMAWLREVKIDIAIYPYGNYSSENYQFDVYKNRHLIVSKDDGYVTYEQAVEEALKYVLENLI